MLSDEACGPGGHVLRIAVADVNFRFVTYVVSHWPNQPDTDISLKMANQSREPTAGNDGVIVQKQDRKSTRLNSSHGYISYAVFCLKKKKKIKHTSTRRPAYH